MLFINFSNFNSISKVDGIDTTPLELLTHELTHALQLTRDVSPENKYDKEKEPIENTNILRKLRGGKLRTRYGDIKY